MSQTHQPKIVILGAGPTGLGAAYRLNELGYRNWAIYERHNYIGGLATSFQDDAGFIHDIGGHVMFSHYAYFDQLVDKLLGNEYTEIQREAWVWMMDRFIPYPFQNNIRHLPREVVYECIMGLMEAHRSPQKVAQAQTFDELIDAQFGAGIATHFMKPYNFKVWAHPVSQMSRDWLGERVAMPDLQRVMGNVLLERDDVGWGPNNVFKYPLYGGTGGLYSRFMPYIQDHLSLNKSAVSIDATAKTVTFDDGEVVSYDVLLNTMPLDLLIQKMVDAPDAMHDAAALLEHSSGLITGIGIDREIETSKCWMYFPEPSAPFYRVTYLNQYSPHITPKKGQTLFLTETSYSAYKPENKADIVERVIKGLIATKLMTEEDRKRIATQYLIDVDYSYPVPTVNRNQGLSVLQPYLMERDIYSRGRFGGWRYEIGNMDHSVMQGVEFVNHVLHGQDEVTWTPVAPAAPLPIQMPQPLQKTQASVNGASVQAAGSGD
jgi:protoporphyrinogen oxidase